MKATINLEIHGIKHELTIEEAKQLQIVLQELVGEKQITVLPYSPFAPNPPIYYLSNPVTTSEIVIDSTTFENYTTLAPSPDLPLKFM